MIDVNGSSDKSSYLEVSLLRDGQLLNINIADRVRGFGVPFSGPVDLSIRRIRGQVKLCVMSVLMTLPSVFFFFTNRVVGATCQ